MAICKLCEKSSKYISRELGVCLQCIRENPEEAVSIALDAHHRSRTEANIPLSPPKAEKGIPCRICVNECRIPEGGMGYCGLRKNIGGKLVGVSSKEGKLSWYHDPIPTNCVGDWICPAGTGAGYPKYAYCNGPEYGYKNLAVFFHACSFNCLFCQNWQFKRETLRPETRSVDDLISDIDEKTSCICYFGGDPTPQLPFSIRAAREAIKCKKNRILRVCWETNGSMNKALFDEMTRIALESGGIVKFDLKAWDENLHIALTGVTNKRTFENFLRAKEWIPKRETPPIIIANTLLVPGYIDEEEIRNITRFIASIDKTIPYSLLAFYPHYYMKDMPLTSRAFAERCVKICKEEGLTRVRLGNVHLLT